MNSWSRRRKNIILLIVLSFLVFVIALPAFLFFYRAPSCSDNKQNGDETGVDCGGSCELLCSAESLPIIMKGDPRVIRISGEPASGLSSYVAVAYVENPNVTAEVYKAGYTFKIYGSTNALIPVKIIEGTTFVPKNSLFAVFEGPFQLPDAPPLRATFEWGPDLSWRRDTRPLPALNVINSRLSHASTSPRLEADLINGSLETLSNIDIAALILNAEGTIIGASKTYVNSLSVGEGVEIVFNWPAPFASEPASTEILPIVLPDRTFIR